MGEFNLPDDVTSEQIDRLYATPLLCETCAMCSSEEDGLYCDLFGNWLDSNYPCSHWKEA